MRVEPVTAESRAEHAPSSTGLDSLTFVVVGHVDHGKSSLIGRLLADTGALPEARLDQVRRACERHAKPFEYAFLVDALKEEQGQGITIDAARIFFTTPRRRYQIVDAPGHVEFLKNMVTGASRADAALLVVDASEGVQENSRRHGALLSFLGIGQVAVVVSKMDLIGWNRLAFERITAELDQFLASVDLRPACAIPASAWTGDNVSRQAADIGWYSGPTVLEALATFRVGHRPVDAPFRMPVQGVYKFTGLDDRRRIVAGTIESGRLAVGDEVVFLPSGKASRIRSIEGFNAPPRGTAEAGEATGFTLTEQVYVTRGEVATIAGQAPPAIGTRLRANVFWLGRRPMAAGCDYQLGLGTARVPVRLEAVRNVMTGADLTLVDSALSLRRHDVGECTLTLARPLAFDVDPTLTATSRFVLFDGHTIAGGGIVREALPDRQATLRRHVLQRNYKWQAGGVSEERRADRYGQLPGLVIVSGGDRLDRKRLAREVEAHLFDEGRHVYFLSIGNVLYGVDADIERTERTRAEHMRRLAEVANILLDAGLIVIATAAGLTPADLEIVCTSIPAERVLTVWLGGCPADEGWDLFVDAGARIDAVVEPVKRLLRQRGIIGQP